MSSASSLLGAFRHRLVREIGMHLGLLAVAMQLGLAVAHIMPVQAATGDTGIEIAWCSGAAGHEPAEPAAAHAGHVCPLCQLPPLGPDPSMAGNVVAPVVWQAAAIVYPHETPACADAVSFRPFQPRAPPSIA
ncbi:MAG: hypothetical protein HY059_19170 [Proteobacteria bacterium]|nr:hypothetical protein [Pseudomonadota bacterium]